MKNKDPSNHQGEFNHPLLGSVRGNTAIEIHTQYILLCFSTSIYSVLTPFIALFGVDPCSDPCLDPLALLIHSDPVMDVTPLKEVSVGV